MVRDSHKTAEIDRNWCKMAQRGTKHHEMELIYHDIGTKCLKTGRNELEMG